MEKIRIDGVYDTTGFDRETIEETIKYMEGKRTNNNTFL